jgi:hypothetical protein
MVSIRRNLDAECWSGASTNSLILLAVKIVRTKKLDVSLKGKIWRSEIAELLNTKVSHIKVTKNDDVKFRNYSLRCVAVACTEEKCSDGRSPSQPQGSD